MSRLGLVAARISFSDSRDQLRTRIEAAQQSLQCQANNHLEPDVWQTLGKAVDIPQNVKVWLDRPEQMITDTQVQVLQLSEVIPQMQARHGQKNKNWLPKCAKMPFSMATVGAHSIQRLVRRIRSVLAHPSNSLIKLPQKIAGPVKTQIQSAIRRVNASWFQQAAATISKHGRKKILHNSVPRQQNTTRWP